MEARRRILSSRTAEVQDIYETYQYVLDLVKLPRIVCKRFKTVVADGNIVSREHSHEIVRKFSEIPGRTSVTLESGKTLTPIEVLEGLEAFADLWEQEDES